MMNKKIAVGVFVLVSFVFASDVLAGTEIVFKKKTLEGAWAEIVGITSRLENLEQKIASGVLNGKDGLNGKNGIDGKDGKNGVKGETGAIGPRGEKGEDGKDGLNGKDGAKGKDGQKGDKGERGEGQLHVYDADGQDLGVLVSSSDDQGVFYTFLPDQKVILNLFTVQSGEIPSVQVGHRMYNEGMYFTELNCIGIVYLQTGWRSFRQLHLIDNQYFTIKNPSLKNDFKSYKSTNGKGCINESRSDIVAGLMSPVSLPFSFPPKWPLEIR